MYQQPKTRPEQPLLVALSSLTEQSLLITHLERFYARFNPAKSGQAEKVWDSVLKKHDAQSAETELNKTLRDKYGCDLGTSEEEQLRIVLNRPGKISASPEFKTESVAAANKSSSGELDESPRAPGKPPRPMPSPAPSILGSPERSPARNLRVPSNRGSPGSPSSTGETEFPQTVGTSKSRGSLNAVSNPLATPPLRPMSAGDDNSSPATDNATTEMLVAKLEAFYEFVNPDQVELAEQLVRRFNSNKGLLNRALREKYGMDLTTSQVDMAKNREEGGIGKIGAVLPSGSMHILQGVDQVFAVNEDFHYFQGFEDIKKTQAGISQFLITPPISALSSRAMPSPLIAPTDHTPVLRGILEDSILLTQTSQEKGCDEIGIPAMSASMGTIDVHANPYPLCQTLPDKLKCLCGHVEITFQAPPLFTFICHCRSCRHCRQAPCASLAAYVDPTQLSCTKGLESVQFCKPEGGDGQPTIFFCSTCSMTCWTLDKFGLTTVALDNMRDPATGRLAVDLQASFHCCYSDRVFDVADKRDKYVDFPAFLGGSDVKLTNETATSDDVDDMQLVHTSGTKK